MKRNLTSFFLVLALALAAVLPASANSTGGDAGTFVGNATVGKSGTCTNDGGAVSGGGIGILPDLENPKHSHWAIDAPGTVNSVKYGLGGDLRLCGRLTGPVGEPVSSEIGASCPNTKGYGGQGHAVFNNGSTVLYISNLGWKVTGPGTFIVTGDIGLGSKKKADLLVAEVQTLDDEVVVGCVNKTTGDKTTPQGFVVVATYQVIPGGGNTVPKKTK